MKLFSPLGKLAGRAIYLSVTYLAIIVVIYQLTGITVVGAEMAICGILLKMLHITWSVCEYVCVFGTTLTTYKRPNRS